jgi:signal peptidase I
MKWTQQCLAVYTQHVRRQVPLKRFVVRDTSMRPALEPGDRVLVWQWARDVRPGDIVVFVEPGSNVTASVKRVVAAASEGGVLVRGDNVNVSRDSRDYGAVPLSRVFGRAVYRYLPGTRRGRL